MAPDPAYIADAALRGEPWALLAVTRVAEMTLGFERAYAPDPCCRVCAESEPCDCDDGGVFEGSWDANGSPVEAP